MLFGDDQILFSSTSIFIYALKRENSNRGHFIFMRLIQSVMSATKENKNTRKGRKRNGKAKPKRG